MKESSLLLFSGRDEFETRLLSLISLTMSRRVCSVRDTTMIVGNPRVVL